MRKLLVVLVMLTILGIASAEWAEKLRVQTVDKYGNPISGCLIEVNYQKSASDSLDGRASGRTNGDGIYEVNLRNFVSNNNGKENKAYYITMSNPFGLPGVNRRVEFGDNPIEGVHLEQFQLNKTSAKVSINVKDQKNKPVPNATITFLTVVTGLTDADGNMHLWLPLGTYTANVAKESFTANKQIALQRNVDVTIPMVIYENRLSVLVTNEYAVPIEGANLTFNKVQRETNASGEAVFAGLRVASGTLVAKYGGMERTLEIKFQDENVSKTVVFPSSPLVIDHLTVETRNPYEDNCTIVLGCRARDERVALSKTGVSLIYSVNGGQWTSIEQKNELGIFEFRVPCSAPMVFSYKFSASNEYGSAETPMHNITISTPLECQENQTGDCTTSENCPGIRECVSGSWGRCMDLSGDGCPAVITNNTNSTPSGNSWFNIQVPDIGIAMTVFLLLGALVLIGGLGVLLMTQKDKVSGLFNAIKERVGAIKHVDKVIERADKEYEREKVSEKFMKEGKTDQFFGLDKEEKDIKRTAKPPEKPPAQPPATPPKDESGGTS